MPRRNLPSPPPRSQPQDTRSGTVAHSLKTVGKFCQGPEHNDYYEFATALELALSLMPPESRTKFDQLFTKFKRDDDKPQDQRKWKGLPDFIAKIPVVPPDPRIVVHNPNYQA